MNNGRCSVRLPSSIESARIARGAVRDFLTDRGVHGDDLDVALVVASELVTNAVAHGKPPITLELEWLDDGALRLEVCDAGTFLEDVDATRTDDLSATGRGLKIVRRFARAWRLEPRARGTSISAEIRTPQGAAE